MEKKIWKIEEDLFVGYKDNTEYKHQWQHCNIKGETCDNVPVADVLLRSNVISTPDEIDNQMINTYEWIIPQHFVKDIGLLSYSDLDIKPKSELYDRVAFREHQIYYNDLVSEVEDGERPMEHLQRVDRIVNKRYEKEAFHILSQYKKVVIRFKTPDYVIVWDEKVPITPYSFVKSYYFPIKKAILTSTISPSMIKGGGKITIKEISEDFFNLSILLYEIKSVVGHENMAKILSNKFNASIVYNRENITIGGDTEAFAAVPQVRFDNSREYTDKEIKKAKFRYFVVI